MYKKLDIKALSLSLGVLWACAILLISIVAILSQSYLHNIVNFFSSIYLGYDLSLFGIVIGMFWAFVDAALGGLIFAWLYNKLAK